jgi:kinesin family member 5
MEGDVQSEENKGIIPRAVGALFDGVTEADENMEFTFKVSYVEIYLEKIRDLLDENRVKVNLTIREDKIKGIYIAGVTEEYVTSMEETLAVMNMGTYRYHMCIFPCVPSSVSCGFFVLVFFFFFAVACMFSMVMP